MAWIFEEEEGSGGKMRHPFVASLPETSNFKQIDQPGDQDVESATIDVSHICFICGKGSEQHNHSDGWDVEKLINDGLPVELQDM